MTDKNRRHCDNSDTIEEEERCKRVFEQYLVSEFQLGNQKWDRGEPGQAPDFWLSVGGKSYAVEVTRIYRSFQGKDREMPRLEYHAHGRELAKAIEKEAKDKHILKGEYRLFFKGDPAYNRQDEEQIIIAALEYIKNTSSTETSKEERIYPDIIIKKVSLSCNTVDGPFHVPRGSWEIDYTQKIVIAINKKTIVKNEKLSEIAATCDGVILLILNKMDSLGLTYRADAIAQVEMADNHNIDDIYLIQSSNKPMQDEIIPIKCGIFTNAVDSVE